MGLLERLRRKSKDRRQSKRIGKFLTIDMDPSEFASSLLSRVEDCIEDSISRNSDIISAAIGGHKYLNNLLLTPLRSPEVTEETIEEIVVGIALPQFRLIESLKLLEDSLLLGLSGRYTAGFSAMRTALECMIVGGFYHGLSRPEFRKRAKIIRHWKGYGYTEPFLDMVENLLEDIGDLNYGGLSLIIAVEDILANHDPPLSPPNFRKMVSQIVEWYGLNTIDDPVRVIADEIYEQLSVYTHAMQDATTYKQFLMSREGEFLMESGKVNSTLLESFFEMYIRVLDISGAVFFSLIQEQLQALEWKNSAMQLLRDSYQEGKTLEDTTNTIFDIMGLSRVDPTIVSEFRKLIQGPITLSEIDNGLQVRYQQDTKRVDLFPSTFGMMFADVRIWRDPIWDIFKMGLQINRISDEECRIAGMCRATKFDVVLRYDYLVEQLDRIAVIIVEELVDSRGADYEKTIDGIRRAYLEGTELFYLGGQTWEVDWTKHKNLQ